MALHRTSRLSVRASPAELESWNYIAHQHGHATTSHWIRVLLSSAELAGHDGSRIPDELREIRYQLSRIGNNLNQLAHSAHCGDAVHCGAVLDELETLIGSFTRLTKVRMAEFRTLLAQEKQQTAPQIKPVLPPGRIPVRGMKEYLKKTEPAPAVRRTHRTMSLDEIRQRACIVGRIKEKEVILTCQAPERSLPPLNRTYSLTQWTHELTKY